LTAGSEIHSILSIYGMIMIAIAGEVVQQGEKGVNDQGGSGHDIDE
jgi:hypothetical protein